MPPEGRCGSARPCCSRGAGAEPCAVLPAALPAGAGTPQLGPCPPQTPRRVPQGRLFPPCAGTHADSEPAHPQGKAPVLPRLPAPCAPPAPPQPTSPPSRGSCFRHQFGVDMVLSHVSIPSHSSLHLQASLGLNRDRLSLGARFSAFLWMVSPKMKWDLLVLCLRNLLLLKRGGWDGARAPGLAPPEPTW